MIRNALARVPSPGHAVRRAEPPRPRRVLACRWGRCPATGALTCRWEVAGPDLTVVEGGCAERGQPPSRLSLAA